MVEVTIRGKKFPLCMTVAALDQINAKCGGIDKAVPFLMDKPLEESLCNTAWMLGLLVVEGEENRLMEARFTGEKAERRAVPDSEMMSHIMSPGQIIKYRGDVIRAINEGLHMEIKADTGKNGEEAVGA